MVAKGTGCGADAKSLYTNDGQVLSLVLQPGKMQVDLLVLV